ncbi:MAG TPA: N-6 DNA methylase [Candidatus Dojkabacteria bacterium]|nr:N-6 DNA methylase [Candidatus Dojkabacteria bacterium]
MSTILEKYIENISKKYTNDHTSEYGYRTDFEILLSEVFEKINVKEIEHDAKTKEGNKPDFIVTKNSVPILYIETKDIGVDLDKVETSGQMTRFYGYENLVLTDYVEFRFYRNGERYEEPIVIATYNKKDRTIQSHPEKFEQLQKTLIDFTLSHKEPIKSGFHLSKIMGGKAQRIRDNILQLFDSKSESATDLAKVYETIKQLLIHDLSYTDFADMYAQTLVYGLFVARFHDESKDTFTRTEARELIPASNPFLRHFFDHIAGPDFNKRLEYIVNELCEVFSHADVERLMEDYYRKEKYGADTKGPDPVIHFYEDFLKEYDPVLRKKMGAYYTPQSVVQFIIRSVDQILKTEFGLSAGLSDTSKTDKGIHKVQVLDPATGTGTFYSAVIGHIYKDMKQKDQLGRWPKYVHNDLLPRIHGFELMMAPYTIAHLKLSMAFKKTGFIYFNDRLGIYLTNSLEDVETQQGLFAFGFAESIAQEFKEASKIKKETPIMVVVGNPPYSVSSTNKGDWITKQLNVYKQDLNERNIQPLSDDYIKFIRYAEHFIEKNKSGIVAMITNNSFIDGLIHRQMRKHLLETFDDIYILDLHGNSKKKEKAPDGSKDENVFDIMQGVSINIFIRKTEEKAGLGKIHHFDLYGAREEKFKFLDNNLINTVDWTVLDYDNHSYYFVPKDFSLHVEYESHFKLNELFKVNTSGVKTHNDKELVSFDTFEDNNRKYLYRPFDVRNIEYDLKKVVRHRNNVMKHVINDNLVLLSSRQLSTFDFQHILVTKYLSDICAVSMQTKESTYGFPLYLYTENETRIPNLDTAITSKISKQIGEISPEELFNYIYSVLHSPSYRQRYKEFLKVDFPRIPYPTNRKMFDEYAKYGKELRELHLMESPLLQNASLPFPESGSDTVENITYKDNKVFINETQYFGNVSEIAWNFYIGGYQPAQKWLKDRKGKSLSNEDIEHYQKIVFVLENTDRIMKEIDKLPKSWEK